MQLFRDIIVAGDCDELQDQKYCCQTEEEWAKLFRIFLITAGGYYNGNFIKMSRLVPTAYYSKIVLNQRISRFFFMKANELSLCT